ncbi:MAG: hypothetical protein JST16_11110 [Bdellovibrionales bacterium]|nr:hypothetical protein [Bdellovibrionales bacterium]
MSHARVLGWMGVSFLALGACSKKKVTAPEIAVRPTAAGGTLSVEQARQMSSYSNEVFKLTDPSTDKAVDLESTLPDASFQSSKNALSLYAATQVRRELSLLSPFSAALPECAQVTEGSLEDADLDGIPALLKFNFNCTSSQTDVENNSSGTMSILDKDDHRAMGGLRLVLENLHGHTVFSRGKEKVQADVTANIVFDQTIDDKSITNESERSMSVTMAQKSLVVASFLRSVITPTEMKNAARGGTVDELKGFLRVVDVDRKIDVILSVNSEGLVYNSTTCPGFRSIEGGKITFHDGTGNELVYAFDRCNRTTTYNGQNL